MLSTYYASCHFFVFFSFFSYFITRINHCFFRIKSMVLCKRVCYYIYTYLVGFFFFIIFFFKSWYRNWVQFIKANIQTVDIWHANRTICVMNGSNNESPKDLTCFNMDDFGKSWIFPRPEVRTQLNCRYICSSQDCTVLRNLNAKKLMEFVSLHFFNSDRDHANRLDYRKLVLCQHRQWFNRSM